MINIRMQSQNNRMKPRITVVGVGGAGGNAVNNMINSHLEGCEFLVCNTDAQALEGNSATHKIQLGVNVTRGLGAGANPEIGRAAAEESIEEIMSILEGSNMVFVTAGMGGGTGTGAAAVIAQAAREAGILTVGVVTKPFHFEGTHRMKLAEAGISELQKNVDTLIIIPNQNLFRIANEKTTFSDAFKMADEVLQSGVRGVTDLMVLPGLINLDFADIRAVMAEMGKAMMGTGEAVGDRRAVEAAEAAISNPLLDDISMKGARGVLINITGGLDMTLFEVDEAANRIRDEVDPDANIIFGSTFDEALQGRMRVSVVATGIEANAAAQPKPLQQIQLNSNSNNSRPQQQYNKPQQQQQQASGGYGGYNGYTASTGRQQQQQQQDYSTSAGVYATAPAGVLPQQGATMTARQPVTAQRTPVASEQPVVEPTVGYASSVDYGAQGSAVRKPAEAEMIADRDYPVTAAETQTIQRNVQPKAERHGNSFIPPKPVDPKSTSASANLDLFAEEVAAPVKAEKPKKSPSLFERFTMRNEEPVQQPKAEAAPKLTVEAGGKTEEDELDIPAFLRRQAN